MFHVFAIGFNYITHFTMFTMFHNISRKICPNFLVKYCALSSQKWQHWFAAATRAVRIPYATMLTASNLSQSYQNHNQVTTHWPSEFAGIHSISKTIRTSCDIAIVLEEGSPFAWRMLGIPQLQALIQLFADKLFTGLKRLRTAPHLGPWKEVVYISNLR